MKSTYMYDTSSSQEQYIPNLIYKHPFKGSWDFMVKAPGFFYVKIPGGGAFVIIQ